MSNLRLNKIKSQTPISIIIHGGNRVGYLTAKTLIDQGCYVVIIDKFNSKTKKYISELKRSELFDFFDFKGFSSLFKNIKRFDYIFYLLNEKLAQEQFDSKEFLAETKYLEESLINTKKNKAKFSLVTSLSLNRELANRVNNIKLASPSPYSNIELQKYCETLTAEFKDRTDVNARILRLGTVIGKGIEEIASKTIHSLVKDATQKSEITILGEGLDIHNLIHESDATYGMLKLTFSDKTKGEVITLANANNYTTLSIAYKLLELNTEAQSIRFVENKDEKYLIQDLYVPAPPASRYDWVQQVSLEDALIEQIHSYYDQINKSWDIDDQPNIKKTAISSTKVSKTKFGKILSNFFAPVKTLFSRKTIEKIEAGKILKGTGIFVLLTLLTYYLVYPVVGTIIGLLVINSSAKEVSSSILSLENNNSTKEVQKIENNIKRISDNLENLHWAFYITNQREMYDNLSQLLLGAEYTTQGAEQLIDALQPLAQYVKDFEPAVTFQTSTASSTREYREYLQLIEENKYKLDEASYKISLATEIITNLKTTSFPKFLQDKILLVKDLAQKLEDGTKTFEETTSFLPDVLGVDERKRYLILFQNESELRSTGGWLTSYGLVGIEGGQIREIFVDDVYNAEGTLRIAGKKLTPSKSMSNALSLTEWPFSLVNWSPDLSETQMAAEEFIKDIGKGNKLDGVITVDIAVVQKLLDAWGGIEVPGESELITSENIYSKIFEMHNNFTPGSTEKTTFLANLANEMVTKLLSSDISGLIGLSDTLLSSLDEKHLQVNLRNTDALNFFATRNWAGTLDSKYNDAPIAIDWNWGGNKANLYLDKSYNLNVDIKDKDTVDFSYSVSVENNSTTKTYPEGDYVNYQRIYIPSEAKILKISGIENNEYTIYRESGFKVIGGWFNIPIKTTSSIEISYRLERDESNTNFPIQIEDNTAFFDMNIFKQAGEKKHGYVLSVNYPSTWVLDNSGGLNSISNQLSGRFELSKDTNYPIVFRIPN
ncbi:DUF4012 domain-containing protein [Candidatus Microgenomates bacterium]|jgi:nucleoside-diphosphate-sugar epimerase|nr:DUF4012 domain-containing protein [Candidatus Microgenomates bacterium]